MQSPIWYAVTYLVCSHLHRMTYTGCRIDTINSPDDEHRHARNMLRTGINIHEKRILRQVGYLRELNRDARSTKHGILNIILFLRVSPCRLAAIFSFFTLKREAEIFPQTAVNIY